MKPFIVGVALIILLLFTLIFEIDYYDYRIESQNLKYCADEASASAALFYESYNYNNEIEFEGGYKVYNESDGIKAIEKVIQVYLATDYSLNPKHNSYWTSPISYNAYFFDDDLVCSVYKNGIKKSEFRFSYPYLFEDELLGYNKSVSKPSIIVTINAGVNSFRLDFLNSRDVIRSSAYEYNY